MPEMLKEFPTTMQVPPSDTYEAVTFAYDTFCKNDRAALMKELKRLKRHGAECVLYVTDTRGTGKRTQVECERWTRKESVFAEIFKEKE